MSFQVVDNATNSLIGTSALCQIGWLFRMASATDALRSQFRYTAMVPVLGFYSFKNPIMPRHDSKGKM